MAGVLCRTLPDMATPIGGKHRLKRLEFDEVSLVSSGDDPHALMVLAKTAPEQEVLEGLSDEFGFFKKIDGSEDRPFVTRVWVPPRPGVKGYWRKNGFKSGNRIGHVSSNVMRSRIRRGATPGNPLLRPKPRTAPPVVRRPPGMFPQKPFSSTS